MAKQVTKKATTAKAPAKKAAKKSATKPARAMSDDNTNATKEKRPATTVKTKSASKPNATEGKKATPIKRSAKAKKKKPVVLPEGYRPADEEPFMNDLQREYFRQKLLNWREEIIRQTRETLAGLNQDSQQHADLADRATSETDRALELRARDRQRKLVNKINAALSRIDDGSYGYCEDTGEPIGLKRLDARPIATLSLEAQERHERRERVYRED